MYCRRTNSKILYLQEYCSWKKLEKNLLLQKHAQELNTANQELRLLKTQLLKTLQQKSLLEDSKNFLQQTLELKERDERHMLVELSATESEAPTEGFRTKHNHPHSSIQNLEALSGGKVGGDRGDEGTREGRVEASPPQKIICRRMVSKRGEFSCGTTWRKLKRSSCRTWC